MSRAAAIAMLFLAGCSYSEGPRYAEGQACWEQHKDYVICYTKCAAMNPRDGIASDYCLRGVDEAATTSPAPQRTIPGS